MECGEDENNNTDRPTILHFDDIFKHIGSCNRYFLLSFLVLSLCITSVGWNSLAVVFLFPETDFWCEIDDLGERCLELNLDEAGCSALKNEHHPVDKPSTVLNETQCSRYDLTEYDFDSNTTLNNETSYTCISGYEFDNTQYKTSITQEFELVCDDAYLVPLALSLHYVGVLVGSGIFGCISDRLGRKRTLVLCMTTYIFCNIVTLLSQWYWMYVAATTISAAFFQGAIISTYVIGCEFVGPSRRCLAGMFLSIQWSIGYMITSVFAYLIPYWRYLLMAITIADALVCTLIFILVPESPRWLHSIHKMKRASKILKRACVLSERSEDHSYICETICSRDVTDVSTEIKEKTPSFNGLDLLRKRNFRMRFIIVTLIWFVNSMVYYGLSLSAVTLGSNDYIANALSGLVEIPALILSWLAIERMGRRLILCATMILAGVGCISTSFLSNEVLMVTFGMIGKFGITASFTIIYIVCAEIYPTPIRSTAVGLSSMLGCIGGIIAPQALYLGVIWEQLPYLIFGSLSIVAGMLALLLPETSGLNLPQTIKEGEELGTEKVQDTRL